MDFNERITRLEKDLTEMRKERWILIASWLVSLFVIYYCDWSIRKTLIGILEDVDLLYQSFDELERISMLLEEIADKSTQFVR